MLRKFKLTLPILMGAVSALLMMWDIHNQRVIMSVGMGWDTGAPLWPYQTPDTLLLAINAPAYLIATPISRLFDLLAPRQYFALYPAILLWWWLVGAYLDKRHLEGRVRSARVWASLFCLFAVTLICLGVDGSYFALRWWWTYSRSLLNVSDLILLRLIAPSIWCFALSLVALLAARRRAGIWSS